MLVISLVERRTGMENNIMVMEMSTLDNLSMAYSMVIMHNSMLKTKSQLILFRMSMESCMEKEMSTIKLPMRIDQLSMSKESCSKRKR